MMKWWGWGDANVTFPMHEKPTLWPWIKGVLDMKEERLSPPVRREEIKLREARLNEKFLSAIRAKLASEQVKTDDEERLHHAYGKSFPDLFRARQGVIDNPPDCVILPRRHEDVVEVIRLANECDVAVIPFGGGTNIVGCVEATDTKTRMIVSLDMREMNRLLAIDPYSLSATIEAGALGPKLEDDLQQHGYALGHCPDSFQYSTIGGWIATRSAGMQSDAYGRIEDMVISLRVVTPTGEVKSRTVPATSAGLSINHLFIGSEGILGVITEATVRIHPQPKIKDYRGFLFKSFDDGAKAIHQCYQEDMLPSMFRLQDEGESELGFNMKAPKKGLEALVMKGLKKYLKRKGYTKPCIMVVGFEGSDEEQLLLKQERVFAILQEWGSFPLGKSVGKTWSKDKYNIPYLRDYVMDYSCFCDVAETATTWANLLPLYHATVTEMKKRFAADPMSKGWIGCHISHSYKTGASLYFTYAGIQEPGRELAQYYEYKKLVTETFMRNGGTLSHHHAVGYEHLPWLEEEVSATGIKAFKALKGALDPQSIMNPGKLIPRRAHPYIVLAESEDEKRSAG